MQLIRRPVAGRPALPTACVATIGTFDGVHVGHQKILARVRELAARHDLPSLVFSFEPTPAEFFSRRPPARLMRFREKFCALDELALDYFFCPPFDARMEALEPEQFVDKLLCDTLRVRYLVVGDDFRFGRGRAGTFDDLRSGGERCGFSVEQIDSVCVGGLRVSSTAIRKALEAGELGCARNLLGRYYRMSGRVVHGRKLGAELGFPTANVELNRRVTPIAGIFAVRVAGLGNSPLDGVASLGSRPTVDGDGRLLLEVHIFDFDRLIYGQHIAVDFIARLRDEEHFTSLEALVEQMHKDAARAREILATAA